MTFEVEWWVALIVGIILGAFLEPIVSELLPIDLRFRARYWFKRIGKFLRPPSVKTTLIVKTEDLSSRKLEPMSTLEVIRKRFAESGYDVATKGDAITFPITKGETAMMVTVGSSFEPVEESLVLSQIEIHLEARCGYRRFTEHILELTQAQRKVEDVIRGVISPVSYKTTLMCELRSIYELTGLLSEYKIGALSAQLGKDVSLDITQDRIVVYGEDITGYVTSFLKKVITIYY